MTHAFIAILSIYLIATLFYILRMIFAEPKLSAIGLRITIFGMLIQTVVLGIHFFNLGHFSNLTYLEYFQLSALFLAFVFVSLCFAKKFYGSGPFFIILIDLFCIVSLHLKNPYDISLAIKGSGYLFLHLVTIFLSLTIFSIALVTAIMFLLSERQIRTKKFGGLIEKFPPLAVLEDIHYKATLIGFILFTLAILTGAGYSKVTIGHYLSNDPKQILSFLSWIFFAILLNFRVNQGWQGQKGILLSMIGFSSMILLFVIGL